MSNIVGNKNACCRLCDGTGPLWASHIVPEFMFKPLYTNTGPRRFFQISIDIEKPERTFQKGFREYLLCKTCEGRFAAWEQVARELYHGNLVQRRTEISKNVFKFEGLPYTPLKNFWHSLLWRLGVTTVPTWQGVILNDHEATLRKMLLNGDPGEPNQFGCALMGIRLAGTHHADLMIPPVMFNDEKLGLGASLTLIGGIHVFHLPEIRPDNPASQTVLQRNGQLIIGMLDVERIPALTDIYLKFGRAINAKGKSLP